MVTLGIDLSSQQANTAACLIKWRTDGSVEIADPEKGCDDGKLHELIAQATIVGIDAPFGWPAAFTAGVADWTATRWTGDETLQKALRLRTTDIAVHMVTKITPLSVSTNLISLPGMRAMALLRHFGVTDKSGAGRDAQGRQYFEVYPAGSLKQWDLRHNGYKPGSKVTKAEALNRRRDMLEKLRQRLPRIQIPDAYAETDHSFDALIASLTARAAALGRTIPPDDTQRALATTEGWIHLPQAAGGIAAVL